MGSKQTQQLQLRLYMQDTKGRQRKQRQLAEVRQSFARWSSSPALQARLSALQGAQDLADETVAGAHEAEERVQGLRTQVRIRLASRSAFQCVGATHRSVWQTFWSLMLDIYISCRCGYGGCVLWQKSAFGFAAADASKLQRSVANSQPALSSVCRWRT